MAIDFRTVDWHREAERGCVGKVRMGRRAAMDLAAEKRRGGVDVSAYRCPWSVDGRHWHVGHPPGPEGIERIAAAIRNHTNEEDLDDR